MHTPTAWGQTSLAESQVNALEGLAGPQPGSRRSGAKGICASGHFIGNAAGRELSRASVFNGDKIPGVASFSVGGGSPKASDKSQVGAGLGAGVPVARWRTGTDGQHLRTRVFREQARPASYGTLKYSGVKAFEFEAGVLGLTEEQLKTMGDEFLAGELRERVGKAPVSFDFRLQLAKAGLG